MKMKYILMHPKNTIKYITRLEEHMKKLEFSLYGDREWDIKKEDGNLIKAICPCMTEAIEEGHYQHKPEIFTSIKLICPRCNKTLNIPKFREHNAKFLYEDELKENEVIRNLRK